LYKIFAGEKAVAKVTSVVPLGALLAQHGRGKHNCICFELSAAEINNAAVLDAPLPLRTTHLRRGQLI
jgi:hypothetical protein